MLNAAIIRYYNSKEATLPQNVFNFIGAFSGASVSAVNVR